MNETLSGLTLIACVASLAATVIALRKIRSVHLVSFELRQRLTETETEVKALYAQIQALLALERLLDLPQALPAMRGWAGSPDFLLKVAQTARALRPGTVLECSSGVSTLVLARCLQLQGHGHVYSLEHEAEYAAKTRCLLEEHGLTSFATVVHAPLVQRDGFSPWYDESKLPSTLPPVDLLVIDGPPAALAEQARYPALPRLIDRLAPSVTVMLDDAGRPDELALVKRWIQQWPAFKSDYLPMEKGLAVLHRSAE